MEHVRDHGFRTIGTPTSRLKDIGGCENASKAGEVSGLTEEMLAELPAITWLIDPHGRIAIEGKGDVKAAQGHSPDLAEALMLALDEGAPVPYSYTVAPPDPRAGLGYGHRAKPADYSSRCGQHPWRQDCVCLAQWENKSDRRPAALWRRDVVAIIRNRESGA